MKLVVILAVVFLLGVALFSYLMLFRLFESRLAADLKKQYGLKEEPTVEVSSDFPPKLLFRRIDLVNVRISGFVQEGILLRDLRINLEDVDLSVRSFCKET